MKPTTKYGQVSKSITIWVSQPLAIKH